MKKWITIAGLLLLTLPVAVQAEDFTYTTNADNTITITGYTGTVAVLDIPAMIDGLLVTRIDNYAFASCTSLTGVTIPDSVITIGESAFASCSGLISVTIPNSVTSIGYYAFESCESLTSVTIPNSVSNILDLTFYGCANLTRVTIPKSVTNIGDGAFSYCTSLTRITIPNSVTSIENYAFESSTSLTEVYFKGNAPDLGGAFVFDGTDNATVYYLPGTTGWDTWSASPAVLWNPQVQNPGVQSNRFGFNITGTNDFTVVVEARTNLTSGIWVPVKTNTLTGGLIQFSDPASTNYSKRYYRVSMPQ